MRKLSMEWDPCWKPDIAATLLFIVRGGRILLIHKKRGIGAGKISGPGGKFEPGETARQCALRELKEELGIEAAAPVERARLHFSFACGTTPEIRCHVFLARDFRGDPIETEEAEPVWFPADAPPYERMWADDPVWFPHFLAGERFEGFFRFRGEQLLEHEIVVLEQGESWPLLSEFFDFTD
ncbi:MAG: 8-oxo-dGTP diphosphatase [Akkermansiaceae bacterium]|nr:8-oxo-dGTP diphosphatase [Akkermansiaceae bacterium]